MADIRSSLFGRLALETGKVTLEQIQDCLKLQLEYEKAGKKVPRLGEIMAAKGYLTVEQVRDILRQQRAAAAPRERGPDPLKETSSQQVVVVEAEPPTGEVTPITGEEKGGEIFGKFKILKRLGADASGYTYKAKYLPNNMAVVLRVLSHKTMTEDAAFVKKFEEQIKRATELRHENIQRIVAAGRVNGRDFYAAEYIEGISLKQVLAARGKLDIPFALDMAIQITRALEYAHARGVYHQELRPSNILITSERKIKVVGFGVFHDVIGNLRRLSETAGELPFYVAPEQATSTSESRICDARTDIYCLGVTLYHSLTGEPPFKGNSVEEVLLNLTEEEVADPTLLNPNIPKELADIVLAMMNPEPDKRYQNATQLLMALEGVAAKLQKAFAGRRQGTTGGRLQAVEASAVAGRHAGSGWQRGSDHYDRGSRGAERDKKKYKPAKEDAMPITMIAGAIGLIIAIVGMMYVAFNKKKEEPATAIPPAHTAASAEAKAKNKPAVEEEEEEEDTPKTTTKKSKASVKPAPKRAKTEPREDDKEEAVIERPPSDEEEPPAKVKEDDERPPLPTFLRDHHADSDMPAPREEPNKEEAKPQPQAEETKTKTKEEPKAKKTEPRQPPPEVEDKDKEIWD